MVELLAPMQDLAPTRLAPILTGRREWWKSQFLSHDHPSSQAVLLRIEQQNHRLETTRREVKHDQTSHDQPPLKGLLRSGEKSHPWACNVWLGCLATHSPSEQQSHSFEPLTKRFPNMMYSRTIRLSIATAALNLMPMVQDRSHPQPLMAVEVLRRKRKGHRLLLRPEL